MVTLNEETRIESPPDAVWPLLRDPNVVAACIPGAKLSADEDGVWRGTIRVKFGPTVALFKGEATLAFDDDARRIVVDGRGIDGRGASRALANSVVQLDGVDTTRMTVQGEFNVTGPLETFVNAGGVHVARALIAEFASNITRTVAERGTAPPGADTGTTQPPSAETAATPDDDMTATPARSAATANASASADTARPTPPPPQPTRELSATSLLWRAFVGWLKSLFGKGR
ncbi:MAG: SRPBCC family protein [Gammaproteobacteria bacterium]|nr:SRPBCC family protein [Gammaproteobacteria bacterium]